MAAALFLSALAFGALSTALTAAAGGSLFAAALAYVLGGALGMVGAALVLFARWGAGFPKKHPDKGSILMPSNAAGQQR